MPLIKNRNLGDFFMFFFRKCFQKRLLGLILCGESIAPRHDKMGFKWENPRIVSKLVGNVYLSIVKYEFNIFICVHSNLGTFISIEKYTHKENLISL